MQGMGTIFQPHDPLWVIKPFDESIKANPLKYWCAPNAATPDYVASHDVHDFLAYGIVTCWNSLHPDYFTMWNMCRSTDLYDLRQAFLDVFRLLVLSIYDGTLTGEEKESDFDPGQWVKSLNIGNSEEGDDEVVYEWRPGPFDSEAFSAVLDLYDPTGGPRGGDGQVIWCRYDALRERQKVVDEFRLAEEANGLKPVPHLEKLWARLVKKQGKKIKGVYALSDRPEKKE